MKDKIPILGAVLILTISCLIPETEYLSCAGIRTIAMAAALLLLLIIEALPLPITCWTILSIMPSMGVAPDFGTALVGFSNPVVFFILASFGISAAFITLPLSKRILVVMMRRFGKNISSMLLALMFCILPIAAFVSSIPTCALFMSIGINFLDLFEDESAKKATGKAFMIAIPIACLVSGLATPVGSTMNLLAIGLLEQHNGQTIPFVQWMLVGIPIALMIIPMAWLLIYKIYKPGEINPEMVRVFIDKLAVPYKMSAAEKKALIITGTMVGLWILSSWVSEINVMIVALLGTCVMFFPGIKVLKWKSFIKNVNLDAFFMIGTVLSVGEAMWRNGVSAWIATLFPAGSMPLPLLIAYTVTLIFTLLFIMPVAPSIVMFMAVPLMELAQSMAYNPAIIIMALAMATGNCYLLPLDPVPMITYGAGYYYMLDMLKSTLPLQIYVIAVLSLALWAAGLLLGLA